MSLTDLIEKYTGQCITDTDLQTTHDDGDLITELADMLRSRVYGLQSTEHQLLQIASSLQEIAATIRANVHAVAGEPIRHLNSMGELLNTGVRADMLIAQRAERIDHLRALVWLWRHRTTPAEPAAATPGDPTA